ncbi:MAG TPA: DUF3810 family protein [Terriglobia bacterium]|nr:DUF3810 family protein [Terriglobia bacterium]
MVISGVKHKLPFSVLLFLLAAVTFLASWLRLFPRTWVESAYARGLFPGISYGLGFFADLIPFSWLDLVIAGCIAILIYGVSRRRWRLLLGTVSFLYLWFFWTWGLNYHRPPVSDRLDLDTSGLQPGDYERFSQTAIQEINRLWPLASRAPLEREAIAVMAMDRVERVVLKVDGKHWRTTHRVKTSLLLDPWYAGAGIDGMFNPFGHEPLVVKGPFPFELPFLMSHEIAHVRGIANEGEANLIALLATVASDDPRFQYSGWLELWGYLGIPESLDPGPQADLRAARDRIRSRRIAMISYMQVAMLDAHLKANAVPGGIRSYSDIVALAIASQPRWSEFK